MHVDPKQHETGPSEEEEELLCTEELLGGGGVLEEEGAEGADEDEGVALQVGQPQPLPSVSQPLSRGSPIVVPGGHPLHDASQHDRDPVSSPNVCLHHSHRSANNGRAFMVLFPLSFGFGDDLYRHTF